MTITITRTKLAIAIVAVAMLIPATAVATHVFVDVDDGRFYAEPVAWAAANGITTGKSPTVFDPQGAVTRGESVTFLKRYHDNLVEPGLADVQADADTNTADIASNTAGVAGLGAAMPFAATAYESAGSVLTVTPTAYVSVTVTAPVDGHVTVNSTATVYHAVDGGDLLCQIVESTAIPGFIDLSGESMQWFEGGGFANTGSLAGTRTFEIAEGATVTYVLACEELANGGQIIGRNLTAIFTPAP